MTTKEIVEKLWNLCNVLRDDGITYQQYVTELTYLLFLKMMEETGKDDTLPEGCRWKDLREKSGVTLVKDYNAILRRLGEGPDQKEEASLPADTLYEREAARKEKEQARLRQGLGENRIRDIYSGAVTSIQKPANLEKLITSIDGLDWFSARDEGLGDLYEGLLEKNAGEKKSGAGQYFTPRVLIDVMTRLTAPKAGETCNDPACGTFGFMIAAYNYVKEHTGDFFDLSSEEADFEIKKAFTGCELVPETHRLALMNALLHGIESPIRQGDTLSPEGESMKGYDVVLTNPPFGTKKGGERAQRSDFTYPTSNKQLNFLQHIYRSLARGGRAAVVLPDNVLFADGDGEKIRADLMEKCDLHTILRLPTGIFYAQGVKTNVLFFERGETDEGNTKEVWYYDLRTNMPSFGKTHPLAKEDFAAFEAAYTAEDRSKVEDERWHVFTREEIREKGNTLDLGLIPDKSVMDYEDLPDPADSAREGAEDLEAAAALLRDVMAELRALEGTR